MNENVFIKIMWKCGMLYEAEYIQLLKEINIYIQHE